MSLPDPYFQKAYILEANFLNGENCDFSFRVDNLNNYDYNILTNAVIDILNKDAP